MRARETADNAIPARWKDGNAFAHLPAATTIARSVEPSGHVRGCRGCLTPRRGFPSQRWSKMFSSWLHPTKSAARCCPSWAMQQVRSSVRLLCVARCSHDVFTKDSAAAVLSCPRARIGASLRCTEPAPVPYLASAITLCTTLRARCARCAARRSGPSSSCRPLRKSGSPALAPWAHFGLSSLSE